MGASRVPDDGLVGLLEAGVREEFAQEAITQRRHVHPVPLELDVVAAVLDACREVQFSI